MSDRHHDLLDTLYDVCGVKRSVTPKVQAPITWGEFKDYVEGQGVRDEMLVESICVYPADIKNDTIIVDIYPEGQREVGSTPYVVIY